MVVVAVSAREGGVVVARKCRRERVELLEWEEPGPEPEPEEEVDGDGESPAGDSVARKSRMERALPERGWWWVCAAGRRERTGGRGGRDGGRPAMVVASEVRRSSLSAALLPPLPLPLPLLPFRMRLRSALSGSMSIAGRMRIMSGLRVGTHAQMMPTLTSTADHISEREAFQAKSGLCP